MARESGVSTSALFRWRKEYPQPTLSKGLVPIVVASAEMSGETTASSSAVREAEAGSLGLLKITLGDAHIRVSGLVDTHVLHDGVGVLSPMLNLPTGTCIRLAAKIESTLQESPFSGHC